MKLALLDIKIFRIPLPEPIEAAAAGVMSGFDMIMVRATDDQGEGLLWESHQMQGAHSVPLVFQ